MSFFLILCVGEKEVGRALTRKTASGRPAKEFGLPIYGQNAKRIPVLSRQGLFSGTLVSLADRAVHVLVKVIKRTVRRNKTLCGRKAGAFLGGNNTFAAWKYSLVF